MKIYSDVLTTDDLRAAARYAGVTLYVCDPISRTRIATRAWEVSLSGSSPYTSQMGDYHKAATYDEHGHWMAYLFAIDANARISWWKGRDDFEERNDHKYVVPEALQVKLVTQLIERREHVGVLVPGTGRVV